MKIAWSCSILLLGLSLAAGPGAAQEAPAPPAQPAPRTPTPRASVPAGNVMFHVALVLAESGPEKAAPQPMPKGVQKALDDIRDFLPFRSYHILDTALVRGSDGEARTTLAGPGGEGYTAVFTFSEAKEEGGFLVDRFTLDRAPRPPGKPLGPGIAPQAPEPPQASSFRIRRGETVVVGSSGLRDGKALIVILSVMP
jgi:hypothetical protein